VPHHAPRFEYSTLLTDDDDALIRRWLEEASGELLVSIHLPHSGASPNNYLVRSADDVHQLLRSVTSLEVVVDVLAGRPFPLRGAVDDAFIGRAVNEFGGQGESWWIVGPDTFAPNPVGFHASGNTVGELVFELASLEGEGVWVGVHPLDRTSHLSPSETLRIEVLRNRRYGGA
jgi:hypothetical protein